MAGYYSARHANECDRWAAGLASTLASQEQHRARLMRIRYLSIPEIDIADTVRTRRGLRR
jgi:hypothetical protein